MAAQIVAYGLRKLEYGVIGTGGALPSSWVEIPVVHDDTFKYVKEKPEVKKLINQISNQPYYATTKDSSPQMDFSIGKYDLELKAKFMGGTYTAATAGSGATWTPAANAADIFFAFRGTTKDGVQITFPKGQVTANHDSNDGALGLSLSVMALVPDGAGLKIEEWNDGVKTA